jgi:SPP1 gp7 family putative phage head morphogenesis protein
MVSDEERRRIIDGSVDQFIDKATGEILGAAVPAYIKGNLQTQTYEKIKPSFGMAQDSARSWFADYRTGLEDKGGGVIDGEFVPWMKEWDTELREKLTEVIDTSIDEGWSTDETSDSIQELLGVESARGDRIARTEIARAMFYGRMDRIRQGGYTMVRWKTAPDRADVEACDDCKALDRLVFPIDDFPEQPLHPNCRCTCSPVLSSLAFPGEKPPGEIPAPPKPTVPTPLLPTQVAIAAIAPDVAVVKNMDKVIQEAKEQLKVEWKRLGDAAPGKQYGEAYDRYRRLSNGIEKAEMAAGLKRGEIRLKFLETIYKELGITVPEAPNINFSETKAAAHIFAQKPELRDTLIRRITTEHKLVYMFARDQEARNALDQTTNVKFDVVRDGRSSGGGNTITYHVLDNREGVYIHEKGHIMEHYFTMKRDNRIQTDFMADTSGKLMSLKTALKRTYGIKINWGAQEMVLVDKIKVVPMDAPYSVKLDSVYQAKYYGPRDRTKVVPFTGGITTERLSTGLEEFIKNPVYLYYYEQDRFNFILNEILLGGI